MEDVTIGSQITVVHRDGTKRLGTVFNIFDETPRGPQIILYSVHTWSYAAYPAYGDKVTLGHKLEEPKVPAAIFVNPDGGMGPEKVEAPTCPDCENIMTEIPKNVKYWACTMPSHKHPYSPDALVPYWCQDHGQGWCGVELV